MSLDIIEVRDIATDTLIDLVYVQPFDNYMAPERVLRMIDAGTARMTRTPQPERKLPLTDQPISRAASTPKPKELLRVGFREPMTVARLLDIIKFANAEDDDLVRIYNSNLIFERPASASD